MDFYKIKDISKIKEVIHAGGEDFTKFKINESKIHSIKLKLNNILKQFENYENDFEYLPIKFHFSKLIAKSHRFKAFLKEKSANKLKQVDSKYIFNEKGELKDEIEIVYSASKADILSTLNKKFRN